MNLVFGLVPLQFFPIALFFISFFGLITSRSIIKSIVFTMLITSAVVMFWLMMGAYHGTTPPIISDVSLLDNPQDLADPLPQAMMLTAIVIGVSVIAINITMLNTLFRKYKTVDWAEMAQKAAQEEDE